MFGIKIINKENKDVNELLRSEMKKATVDEFKVTTLVELGANGVNIHPEGDKSGFEFAVKQGFSTYLSTLLNRATPNDNQLIVDGFKLASQIQNEYAMLLIISSGIIKVSRKENKQQTLLMIAVKHGNKKVVKELLKMRANMHAVDQFGKSVLDYAEESQSDEVVRLISHVIKKDNDRIKKLKEKQPVTA